MQSLNLVLTSLGIVELTDVTVVGHVELNSAGKMTVNLVDSNSMLLTAGSNLIANTLSCYGLAMINSVNATIGLAEGYDVNLMVDKDLQHTQIVATRDVTVKSNSRVGCTENSKITALYGNVNIAAKHGVDILAGAAVTAKSAVNISANADRTVNLHGSVAAQSVKVQEAATVNATVKAQMGNLIIAATADNASVTLDMTDAGGCNVTMNLAGAGDQVTIHSGADQTQFSAYADRVEVANKGTVFMSGAETVNLNAAGADTTVNIVQTPGNMTVNTAGGNDVIHVGVLFEAVQAGVSGTQIDEGWLSAGATHVLVVESGDGNDRVNMNSVRGELKFSGGAGEDLLYIQEYGQTGGFDKYPIGPYGAYQNVETVIMNRIVDRYTVVEGDTLTAIADKFGVTVADLVAWNGAQILEPDMIYPGQVFVVVPYTTEEIVITDRVG